MKSTRRRRRIKPLSLPGCGIIGKLLHHVKMDTKCTVALTMEEIRSKWTNYSNLKVWFDCCKQDLLELGVATEDDQQGVLIPDNQLAKES